MDFESILAIIMSIVVVGAFVFVAIAIIQSCETSGGTAAACAVCIVLGILMAIYFDFVVSLATLIAVIALLVAIFG